VRYLLDTNLVSEWTKPRPDVGVVSWLAAADEDSLTISVVTLAEIRRGIEKLSDGVRKTRLNAWLREDLSLRFAGRILAVDEKVADLWGRIVGRSELSGRPIGAMDAFIAATAESHELTLVTRNVSDFERILPDVINPWMG
jgi:hypothetical protein